MRGGKSTRREPTIALINVVFLMLVFFLIAGTVAPSLNDRLSLVRTETLEGAPPPDALVVRPDATLTFRGDPVDSPAAFAAGLSDEELSAVRIVPDRDLLAADLVRVAGELRAAGAERVLIVTERGLE